MRPRRPRGILYRMEPGPERKLEQFFIIKKKKIYTLSLKKCSMSLKKNQNPDGIVKMKERCRVSFLTMKFLAKLSAAKKT